MKIMSKIVDSFNEKDIKHRLMDDMGFSDKKSSIYISILKLGEATSAEIAKNAKIKRTTVYNLLPELLNEGIIHKHKKDKKVLFYVEDTMDLINRIEERKIGVEEIIPVLNKLHMSTRSKPKIIQYEGVSGITQLYKDIINGIPEGGELLSVLGTDYSKDIVPFHILEYYSNERIRKNITHRAICVDTDFMREFQLKDKDDLREIRFIKDKNSLFSSDIRIFGNKLAMISFKDGFIGVIIDNEDLAKLNKVMFENVWRGL